jgi:hypothetical protein
MVNAHLRSTHQQHRYHEKTPPSLLPFFLAACGQKEEAATAPSAQGYTKEFDYAIDASGMFHPDLADEDFYGHVKALDGPDDSRCAQWQAARPSTQWTIAAKSLTVDEVKSHLG